MRSARPVAARVCNSRKREVKVMLMNARAAWASDKRGAAAKKQRGELPRAIHATSPVARFRRISRRRTSRQR